MSQDEPKPPKPAPPEPGTDRETRLAKALRDNLRRRKAAVPPQPKPNSDT